MKHRIFIDGFKYDMYGDYDMSDVITSICREDPHIHFITAFYNIYSADYHFTYRQEASREYSPQFPALDQTCQSMYVPNKTPQERADILYRFQHDFFPEKKEVVDSEYVEIGDTYAKKGRYEQYVGKKARILLSHDILEVKLVEVIDDKKRLVVRNLDCKEIYN